MWHGAAARYEFPASEIAKKGAGGCAVLLQSTGKDGLPGPILGAALIGAQPTDHPIFAFDDQRIWRPESSIADSKKPAPVWG